MGVPCCSAIAAADADIRGLQNVRPFSHLKALGSALLARDPELAPISMFRLCSERASHISLGESSSVVTVSLCAASLAA